MNRPLSWLRRYNCTTSAAVEARHESFLHSKAQTGAAQTASWSASCATSKPAAPATAKTAAASAVVAAAAIDSVPPASCAMLLHQAAPAQVDWGAGGPSCALQADAGAATVGGAAWSAHDLRRPRAPPVPHQPLRTPAAGVSRCGTMACPHWRRRYSRCRRVPPVSRAPCCWLAAFARTPWVAAADDAEPSTQSWHRQQLPTWVPWNDF